MSAYRGVSAPGRAAGSRQAVLARPPLSARGLPRRSQRQQDLVGPEGLEPPTKAL